LQFKLNVSLSLLKNLFSQKTPYGLVPFVKQPTNSMNAQKQNAQHVLGSLVWSFLL